MNPLPHPQIIRDQFDSVPTPQGERVIWRWTRDLAEVTDAFDPTRRVVVFCYIAASADDVLHVLRTGAWPKGALAFQVHERSPSAPALRATDWSDALTGLHANMAAQPVDAVVGVTPDTPPRLDGIAYRNANQGAPV